MLREVVNNNLDRNQLRDFLLSFHRREGLFLGHSRFVVRLVHYLVTTKAKDNDSMATWWKLCNGSDISQAELTFTRNRKFGMQNRRERKSRNVEKND